MKKYIYLLLLTCFSCSDDDEVIPALEPLWEPDERFLFDLKIQYNSFADDNDLYFIGRDKISHLELIDSTEVLESSFILMEYNQNHKMPISSEIFATADDKRVRIASTEDPVNDVKDIYLNIEDLNPDFNGFEFPNFQRSEAMAINSRRECLIPYSTSDSWNLMLVRLSNEEVLDTLETIHYSIQSTIPGFNSMFTFDDTFYYSRFESTYRIDQSYNLQQIIDVGFVKMFTIGQNIYGLADKDLYTSRDGIGWSYLGELDRNFLGLNYQVIGDQSIGYYNSQLFLLEEGEGGFDIIELDNEGLFGHQITSVADFNDKIYVTTLSGVFSKSADVFWMPEDDDSTK